MSELKNKDFFPHPSNLRNDRRMKRAMKDLPGGVGYGAIVLTMERLRCEPDFSYPIEDLDLLADEFDISLPILQTVISKYGFFQIENEELLISPALNILMQPYQERKKQAQIAGRISAEKRKLKQQKQLEELSLQYSSGRSLNGRDTDKTISDKIRKEIEDKTNEELDLLISLAEKTAVEIQHIKLEDLNISESSKNVIIKNKGILNVLDSLSVGTYNANYYMQFLNAHIEFYLNDDLQG